MKNAAHYKIRHWTTATSEADYRNQAATRITVNDRAATRQAIINRVRQNGMEFIERSDWAAHKSRPANMKDDWGYTMIAIQHAGRSLACGPAALQLQEIQAQHMGKAGAPSDDIGYHYALDCLGNVYEGRDIRFKGEHVHNYNTGVIGIVMLENLTTPEEGKDKVSIVRSVLHALGYNQRPEMPAAQRESAIKFVAILREFFKLTTIGGHREFPGQSGEGKICPDNVGVNFVAQLRSITGLAAP